MQKIDSHQHFWKFDPVRDSWITSDMHVIQKDFLPKNLQPLLAKNGFDGCVAVQANQSIAETNFLLELAAENDFIKGVVGWVDLQSTDIIDQLQQWKQYKKLKGFRHVLQGEIDRSFMLQPAFKKGIAALKQFDFTYDLLIHNDQLKYIPDFVNAFPEQKFVIDHLAKPDIKNDNIDQWEQDMMAVAQFENVYCKISGMVTEADWTNWKQADFIPFMDVVAEAFGQDRIMFGSDWPVSLLAASYDEVVGIVEEYFSSFTNDEQHKFFSLNAAKFYNLS
jgi:L-fuconolactonase